MKLKFISEEEHAAMVENVKRNRTVRSGMVAPQQEQARCAVSGASAASSPTKIKLTITSGNPVVQQKYKSKLEERYAAHLDVLVKAGEIRRWWYEPTSFKLAAGKRFRPDFLLQYPEGMERRVEYVEVKSRFNKNIRDGLTHLKWTAQLYPCFTWRIVYWKNGGWDAEYVQV